MSKFFNAIRMLAKMKALDAESAERLINAHEVEQDGGPGSGNHGHKGRPGKRGGSAPHGGGGASGNAGHKGRPGKIGGASTSGGGSFNLKTNDPKEKSKLEKLARELGYKDLDQMRRAGKGMATPEEREDWKESSGGPAKMTTTNPEEKAKLEKIAKELGYKDLDQMRRAGKGMVAPEEKTKWKEAEYNGKKYSYDPGAYSDSSKGGKKNSGNFGSFPRAEGGRGSSKSGTNGIVTGNAGKANNGTVYRGRDYTLLGRGLRSIFWKKGPDGKYGWSGPGKKWESKGKTSAALPNGSGTTRISEQDVGLGLHTINKHLNPDGTLSPERAALHERIIQKLFEGKKKTEPGAQKTFYFLGGGSASGKGNFTRPDTAAKYGMPDKNACTVIDADLLKNELPEYNADLPSGTKDRNKAASFAHEESSALAKRALEAAFANGYDVTLDGTGDGGVNSVLKKIKQARDAGYRVEGRYCTASIENALKRNIERAKKEKRLVQDDSVISIHKNVSAIFEQIASEFDHLELWDHDGPEPVLVATCERGQKVNPVNQELYNKFLEKANWQPPKKKK